MLEVRFCERLFQDQAQELGLGSRHALEQRVQNQGLLALIPVLEARPERVDLVPKQVRGLHHDGAQRAEGGAWSAVGGTVGTCGGGDGWRGGCEGGSWVHGVQPPTIMAEGVPMIHDWEETAQLLLLG